MLSRVDGELIAILAISQRWLGSHISDPHFHMRTRGTHAYHAFPAARATRTPSPAYACGGCYQRVSSQTRVYPVPLVYPAVLSTLLLQLVGAVEALTAA